MLIHCVWSTKYRTPLLIPSINARVYKYIAGIIHNDQEHLMAIGGMPDHIHLLLSIKSIANFVKLICKIKSKSSKFIREKQLCQEPFSWQQGYSAFSVDLPNVERIIRYIKNQEIHHKKESFKTEYVKLLDQNEITYDKKNIFEEQLSH